MGQNLHGLIVQHGVGSHQAGGGETNRAALKIRHAGTGFFQKFPTFEDNQYVEKYDLMEDTGRHAATGNESHKHMWRVPTLYNVELTAPYFHNGAVNSLDEAVRLMGKTQLNKDLSEQQVDEIVAFLGALTANSFPEQELPRLPSMSGKSSVIEYRP